MSGLVPSHQSIPWFSITFFIGYIVVEITCILKTKKPFEVIILDHIIKILISMGKEIVSKDHDGKMRCGIALAIVILGSLATIIYTFHHVFTDPSPLSSIVFCVVMTLFTFPIIIGFSAANELFISWVKKRRHK